MNGVNPYRHNIPGHAYVGNDDLIRRVIRGILQGGEDFAVIGGLGCGKSSFLEVLAQELVNRNTRNEILPLRLETVGLLSASTLFRNMLELLTKDNSDFSWDAFMHEREPYRAFRRAVGSSVGDAVRDRHGRDWVGVVMIDEVDDIASRLSERDPITGDEFFRNLRHLVMQDDLCRHFRMVVTSVKEADLPTLIRSGSPLMLASQELGVLDFADVDELIGVGFPDGMTNSAKARLSELTGRHPYLLQGVLHTLWPPGGVGIDSDQVDRAAASFQRERNAHFGVWLDAFDVISRRVYGCLSARPDGTASLSKLVGAVPVVAGKAVYRYDIEQALSILATHGVIEADEDDYRIAGTMFRDWFHSHAPVAKDEVVEILERLKGLANELQLPSRKRRNMQEVLTEAREMFDGDSVGDPGEMRQRGSEAVKKLWDGVKEVKEAASFADVLIRLAPHLGMAAMRLGTIW